MISMFKCPICGNALIKEDSKRLICSNRHSFDIAAANYVNLLQVNKKHSKKPGDDTEMIRAREKFLSSGYYKKLREKIVETVSLFSQNKNIKLIDIGCGEGYYTEAVSEINNVEVAAFDISKSAAEKTGKRIRRTGTNAEVAVASAFDVPVNDNDFDIALNIFSPLCIPELSRLLKQDGIFIYVIPAPDHLWEMKKLIYETPYKNIDEEQKYDGFEQIDKIRIKYTEDIISNENIRALFGMTPYFWHTPKTFMSRLDNIQNLKVTIDFFILVYKKINHDL